MGWKREALDVLSVSGMDKFLMYNIMKSVVVCSWNGFKLSTNEIKNLLEVFFLSTESENLHTVMAEGQPYLLTDQMGRMFYAVHRYGGLVGADWGGLALFGRYGEDGTAERANEALHKLYELYIRYHN